MAKPQSYDREKFLKTARDLEATRLAKQEEWNGKNLDWIKEHGPIPFQVKKLVFGGS
ncbi:MAG: hypothetical protein V1792_04475 [Pseudomonadota bacterium]